jgi:hypothetical protein
VVHGACIGAVRGRGRWLGGMAGVEAAAGPGRARRRVGKQGREGERWATGWGPPAMRGWGEKEEKVAAVGDRAGGGGCWAKWAD